jgi:hypothetical protein
MSNKNGIKVSYWNKWYDKELNGLINFAPFILIPIGVLVLGFVFQNIVLFIASFVLLFTSTILMNIIRIYNNASINITNKGITLLYRKNTFFYQWNKISKITFVQTHLDSFYKPIALVLNLDNGEEVKILVEKYRRVTPKKKYQQIISLIEQNSPKKYNLELRPEDENKYF